jgi:hypothetical protein
MKTTAFLFSTIICGFVIYLAELPNKQGLPQSKIAERYKVTQPTIILINTNKTWSK